MFGTEYVLGPMTLDEGGKFERNAVLPGEYRVAVRMTGAGDAPVFRTSDWFQVAPGAEIDQDFEIYERRLRVELLDETGQPVPKRMLMLVVGTTLEGVATTDDEGNFTLENAPCNPVLIRVGERSAMVQMPLGKRKASVVARLRK